MASTSMSLGRYWEAYIQRQVATGRFKTASEVLRAALRGLEIEDQKIAAMKVALQPGLDAADRGEYDDGFDIEEVIKDSDRRAKSAT